jgi:hypothetical protein
MKTLDEIVGAARLRRDATAARLPMMGHKHQLIYTFIYTMRINLLPSSYSCELSSRAASNERVWAGWHEASYRREKSE